MRQVVSTVDAPVVAYELGAGHLFGHLDAHDRCLSVIGTPVNALVAGPSFGVCMPSRLHSVMQSMPRSRIAP